MLTRPLLKIEKLNPALFKFVVELREVKVRYTKCAVNSNTDTKGCLFANHIMVV